MAESKKSTSEEEVKKSDEKVQETPETMSEETTVPSSKAEDNDQIVGESESGDYIAGESDEVQEVEASDDTSDEETYEEGDDSDDAEDTEDTEEDEDDDSNEEIADYQPSVPQEEFDWEGFDEDVKRYGDNERQEMGKMYDDTLTSINEHEVIKGKVVDLNKKEVVINVGYKSEGIVQASEFRYNPELKIGDEVDVYVENQEDREGQLVISHKTARTHAAWRRVNDALANNEVIMGFVKCRTKGGLIVDVFGIEAFLPGSQIDVKPIRDYDMYVGKNMEFKVVKINHEFKNVVVSHKALIEAELEEQKKQIIGGLEKGQVLEGTVKNITSYGVFIDLGGVDGLIHITDLSWGRINHPEEVVQLDQKLNVVILDFDDDKKRIALGLKQLTDHPWDQIQDELEVGKKVKGKVVVLADYGAFVEIAPGVEGLIHVSEMSWSQHLRSAQDFLKVGDEVEAEILTLDKEDRKMSLGIKQLIPDPWNNIADKYPVGSKHESTVRNFTNFGVFVELEEGVDGLIHISDLSWSKKIKHPSEFCNVGDKIEVIVLEVDQDNRRLSLGHKQLEENPWDVFETVFSEGSVHEGTITALDNNNATVALPYGVEGTAPAKHLRKEDGSTAKVDEKLDFVVLEFSKNSRRIIVSHTRTFEEDPKLTKSKEQNARKADAKAASMAVKNINSHQERTTLGDLDVLADLKQEMEKGEGEDKGASKE